MLEKHLKGFKPLRSGALDRTLLNLGLNLYSVICFKPLRSGALDRTLAHLSFMQEDIFVSNPFVAGHWIVHEYERAKAGKNKMFQTPS